LVTSGFIVLGFTAFFEPIVSEFGWSHTEVAAAASFRGAEVGLLAPLIGLIIDRRGPKWIMFWGIIIIGLGLILMSQMTSIIMFYSAFVLIAIGVSGISPTVVITAVSNWFRKKIGIAIGIMLSGSAFGGLLVLWIVDLIDAYGWRLTTIILCIVFLVLCIPLTLIIRNKPEQYGDLPDGEQSIDLTSSEERFNKVNGEINISAKQAIKGRVFWHISVAMAINALAMSAIITHIMPSLSSIGITRSDSGLVVTSIPIITSIGRIGAGWFGDRFNKVTIAVILMILSSIGLLLFSYTQAIGVWFLILFIIFYSIGWGGVGTMRAALLLQYYGRIAFGTIVGFSMGLTALGVVIGPLIAGWVFDTYNSYQPAWLLFASLIFVAILIIATTPRKIKSEGLNNG
jgi:sugar phosphate permease